MYSTVCVIYIFSLGLLAQEIDHVRVNITQGVVVGSRASDGEYFEFYGIPYADSTSGRNRFKAPLAPPSFKDVFMANRKDVKCVRALEVGFDGTEDCLIANVFTPSVNTIELLPVMVWVKGREFDLHEEHHLSFANFMLKDLVVVTLNYRESILGYLCLGTETAPGNAGLKDIIAGLKWVRENIAQFGGDPENVILFGHGSGAAAVDLVSLSPMSKGLINKVITQSGNALSPWAVTRNNIKHAINVAEALGHEITNISQLSEVFSRTSIASLMAAIKKLNYMDNSLAFAPCVENINLENSAPFLLKSPYEILSTGEYISLPYLTGFVDKEGTMRAKEALQDDWLEKNNDFFIDFIQSDVTFENEEEALAVANTIRQFHFGDQAIDETAINKYLSYYGDTMVLVSTIREARMRAVTSSSPIYMYQFSYKGSLGEPFSGPLPVDKVAHSEELGYLFQDFSKTEVNEIDLTISDILIERWIQFAKTGIPACETSQIQWQPFTSENFFCIRILGRHEINNKQGGSLEIDLEDPHSETMSFWEQIYEENFLDAEGRWDLKVREENENKEDQDNGDGYINGEVEFNIEVEGSGDIDPDNGGGNSVTTVGSTFFILSLFAVFGKMHMSRLIS